MSNREKKKEFKPRAGLKQLKQTLGEAVLERATTKIATTSRVA